MISFSVSSLTMRPLGRFLDRASVSRQAATALRRPRTAGLRLGSFRRFQASSGGKAKLDESASRSISSSSQAPRPVFFSFDIDVIDPAFAPATGTPEVAGLLPHEAIAFIRALAGMRFRGFDVVEVSPPYDSAGQVTALLAANIVYEFLALTALAS